MRGGRGEKAGGREEEGNNVYQTFNHSRYKTDFHNDRLHKTIYVTVHTDIIGEQQLINPRAHAQRELL